MPTTADELTYARSWIGTTEEDDIFNERFDRYYEEAIHSGSLNTDSERRAGALNYAIEESIRSQLMSMTLDGPSSASAEGNSYSNAQNLINLQQNLKTFSQFYGSTTARVSQFVRYISR